MAPSPDFYYLLTDLFQQTARAPEVPPFIPLEQWPANSPEQNLLESLQVMWNTLEARGQVLREMEEQYRNIFDGTSDGLIIYDLETGRVLEVNPAACAMHDYTREEFIGMQPATFIQPNPQQLIAEQVQAIQAGRIFEAR